MILKPGIPVGICCDHAGFQLKSIVVEYLKQAGIAVMDFGTHSADSCDYPDYAHPCAAALEAGTIYPAIAICGTGNGIGMTMNKHQGVRAALCWNGEIASLARRHNDANCLVLPGRFVEPEAALRMVDVFLNTPFEGERHQRRIDKIPVR